MNRFSILASLPLLVAAGPDAATQAPQQVLAAAREASGWDGLGPDEILVLHGSGELYAVPGRIDEVFTGDGRFRRAFDGELRREVVFDGTQVRRRPISSPSRPVTLYARESELLRAWIRSGFWLSDTAPLIVEPVAAEAPTFDIRRVGGLLTGRVELDRSDHRVRTLRLPDGDRETVLALSDYREIDGIWVAFSMTADLEEGRAWRHEVLHASLARLGDELEPWTEARDFAFDQTPPAVVPLLRAPSGHLFVRASVDDGTERLFLFDTGAGFSGLSDAVADEIGLAPFGSSTLTGLGGGLRATRLRRADRLRIGPLAIDGLVFSDGVDTDRKSRLAGEPVAGVLGWDVMARAVVELRPDAPSLVLHDPDTYGLPAEARWEPLTLHYRVPYLRAAFDGDREGLFMLDSGAGSIAVLFFADATRRLGLLDGHTTAGGTAHGAGGEAAMATGTLEHLTLAGREHTRVPAVFITGRDGETDPYTVGLIGGRILGRYRIVFDYGGGRVALLPDPTA